MVIEFNEILNICQHLKILKQWTVEGRSVHVTNLNIQCMFLLYVIHNLYAIICVVFVIVAICLYCFRWSNWILIIYFANKFLFLLFLFYLADGAMTTVSKMERQL